MAKLRLRQKLPEPNRTAAVTPQEWRALAKLALAAAQRTKDRRAQGIQQALDQGTEQRVLRALHILCEADISREFSA